jgi:hypothetical protein
MTKWMDHLLRDTLEGGAASPPTPCLDAETAAAFADDTLSAHERSRAEAHVAECARCQALLAAVVTMTPPVVARPWWRRPAITWLAPIAVAATAVVVWVNMPRSANMAPPVQSAREAARPAQSQSTRTPPPFADAERPSESARDSRAALSATPSAARSPERERDRTEATDLPAGTPAGVLANSAVTPPPAAAPAATAADMQARETILPSTTVPQAAAAPRSESSIGSESRQASPAEQAPEPPSVAEAVTFGTASSEQSVARRFDLGSGRVIVSSNPTSRWRIGTPGVVQHSADSGSTWRTQSTGVNVPLTAGASPSPSVCWLVGRGGVVLLSTDEGRSWQRVAFPVAVDLVSIRAVDDKTATVVTADRRTFSTSDAGVTWRR